MKIEMQRVVVEYDSGLPTQTAALKGVDLSIEEGEAVALVGPTGSGKTTMLEVMSGLSRPTSGHSRLVGGANGASLRSCVGLVYQFPEFQFFEATVYDDVAFGPRKQGLKEPEVESKVADALRRAALPPEDFATRSPMTLSAGEKRRAAIACILALGRPFLMLDEPTAGLDPGNRDRIIELIASELGDGRGVVVVSHDLEFADQVADRVIVLVEGRVKADAHRIDVFSDQRLLERVGLGLPLAYSLVTRVNKRSAKKGERLRRLLLDAKALADGGS